MRTLALAALLACASACACAHPRPTRLAYGDVELGHCGPRAQIDLELGRACTLTVTANREPARRVPLARADCDALFAAAAREPLSAHPGCTAPQPFDAGVEVTLDDAHEVYACWDSPLAARMAAVADRVAVDWRRGPTTPASCDFADDTIQGELVRPAPR